MSPDLDERLSVAATLNLTELVNLGCELAEVGRLPDAEQCFRQASDGGSGAAAFNLGNCLAEQERWLEAVAAYEVALGRGESDAWLNLGLVLHELGDLVGEIRAYEAAEAAGDSGGALGLAFALREQGDRDAAMQAAQRSAAAGNDTAAAVVACWQWCTSLDPALDPALRAGADHFPSARADLGHLLVDTGRIGEARAVLERGMKLGEVESMLPLGNLYADVLGDEQAAETAYRAGAAHGDAHSHYNLAVLLEERGDRAGAEQHYRAAIEGGDTLAVSALRELLDE
ncbi:tetratricopeptide repeat protein [Terrabacter sp. 2YAF2]|uniref:tetratricopeptide repeat protein n=1 Tax=Terrabacter sp. 2YAF2 TaxID=3233026 RepID=UPI003F96D34C